MDRVNPDVYYAPFTSAETYRFHIIKNHLDHEGYTTHILPIIQILEAWYETETQYPLALIEACEGMIKDEYRLIDQTHPRMTRELAEARALARR
jgi:hypothetical protein